MNWRKWSNRERAQSIPERFRLMSFFIPPIYLIPFLENFSRNIGAVSVVEPLFTYWKYEPARPVQTPGKRR